MNSTAQFANIASFAGLPVVVKVNPRARRISLRLCASTRTVRLTIPPRASQARAVAFLLEQQAWIAQQAAHRLPPPLPFRPGVHLPLGDGDLELAEGRGRTAVREGDRLLVPGKDGLFAGRVRRWLSAEALRVLTAETHELAARLGKEVRKVAVGDFRSRWGSCARDGRIAYSWRIILAPDHVRRAVVAHEVAHLAEHHHGESFWRLAADLHGSPHREARSWLAANGPRLHSFGVEA